MKSSDLFANGVKPKFAFPKEDDPLFEAKFRAFMERSKLLECRYWYGDTPSKRKEYIENMRLFSAGGAAQYVDMTNEEIDARVKEIEEYLTPKPELRLVVDNT